MESDWERLALQDKVKSVRQYSYIAVPMGVETVLRGKKQGHFFAYEFDAQGRIISDEAFTEKGVSVKTVKYEYGENGKLQASFDLLGIKYTGPDSLGCAVAMHQGVAKQIFLESGVDTPGGGTIYKNSEDQSYQSLGLTLPVVVKPCSGGSSIGVYIVNTDEEYAEALKKSFRYEDELVVEPYIKGREFACGIIDGTALPPIEIIPKTGFFDYANTYQDGATSEVCPADIPEEVAERMKELTVKAFNALKLNVYSRADFLLDADGNLFCLEMNTLPGMTSASLLPKEAKVYGIEYGDLCELIIKKSMEARY